MSAEWLTPRMAPYGDSMDVARRRAFDRDGVLRRLDWPLLLSVAALLVIGCALIAQTKTGPSALMTKHVINIAIGAGLGVGAALISYEAMRAYAPFVYGAGVVGLIAVLGIGVTHNSAKSWIRIGAGFEVQPSEFAKVAIVVMLATVLGERREGESDDPAPRRIMLGLTLAIAPMGLIMLQPDLGTTMVFVFTLFAMLLVAPVKMRWVLGLVVAGVAVIALAISVGAIKEYQVKRIQTFTNPQAPGSAQDVAFQITRATNAVSIGGITGAGLGKGEMTNTGAVPVQESDFIFTVAGEELGLVGSTGIVVLFGIVLWRGFRIARRSKDRFGALVAVGVSAWFAIQGFENMGMVMGVTPITGIPLPFLSYGGSSMFAVLLAVGLLQNIHLRTERKAS